MASTAQPHRAVTVGISGGLGVLIPAAVFAATMPLPEVHQLVADCAGPFAVGAVAGVGILAITSCVAERRASRATGGVYSSEQAGASTDAGAPASETQRQTVKGVPVIARAANALSEEEAWADIEALLDEDSPISCDPTHSMDIYEIALAELRREQEPVVEVADEPSDPRMAVVADPGTEVGAVSDGVDGGSVSEAADAAAVEPVSTAVFIALAGGLSASPDAAVVPEGVRPQFELHVEDDRIADEEARDSAMASLAQVDGDETEAVSGGLPLSEVRTAQPDAAERAALWARAIAILETDIDPEAAPVARPHGAHFAQPAELSRSAAVSEGAQSTALHSHVNALLGEELAGARSQSVRRTGREYLRVIQGGTASMPRMTAEA